MELKKKFKILEDETKITEIKKVDDNIEIHPDVVVQQENPTDNSNLVIPVEQQELQLIKEEDVPPPVKKRRTGLVQEIIISVSFI